MLDLSSLKNALLSLERAISRAEADKADVDFKDVVIHRFEYTYELSWKMMKRQMESDAPSATGIDSLNFRDLFRHAHVQGLIKDPEAWFVFRQQRNITSHTYNLQKAQSVYSTALEFAKSARELLDELEKRTRSI